jgi:hypothetical protein
MRLDSIFKALGVETIEDVERLTASFVKDDKASIQEKFQQICDDRAVLIHPNQVISAIKSFSDQTKSTKATKESSKKDPSSGVILEESGVEENVLDESNYGIIISFF